ncbi:hypothetical protein BVG19_g2926 [[Candida] boidinii]|nr:hypothetical protein BVG19_g2926 [[Candida] boidinii]OWB52013.1 hypothetical protein B5S27_g3584 [[Candida] boidinii]
MTCITTDNTKKGDKMCEMEFENEIGVNQIEFNNSNNDKTFKNLTDSGSYTDNIIIEPVVNYSSFFDNKKKYESFFILEYMNEFANYFTTPIVYLQKSWISKLSPYKNSNFENMNNKDSNIGNLESATYFATEFEGTSSKHNDDRFYGNYTPLLKNEIYSNLQDAPLENINISPKQQEHYGISFLRAIDEKIKANKDCKELVYLYRYKLFVGLDDTYFAKLKWFIEIDLNKIKELKNSNKLLIFEIPYIVNNTYNIINLKLDSNFLSLIKAFTSHIRIMNLKQSVINHHNADSQIVNILRLPVIYNEVLKSFFSLENSLTIKQNQLNRILLYDR